jgi:uncharacterized protein (UPF0335 family)
MSEHENTEVGGIAADRLCSIVERIERLEEEKKALSADIKDVYAEAKSAGFDVKALRAVIRLGGGELVIRRALGTPAPVGARWCRLRGSKGVHKNPPVKKPISPQRKSPLPPSA